jgi:hypothetical protein
MRSWYFEIEVSHILPVRCKRDTLIAGDLGGKASRDTEKVWRWNVNIIAV